jgi:hypothetical protein
MSNDIEQVDGIMADNVERLSNEVVGHRIVKAETIERRHWYNTTALALTLDTGKVVILNDTSDCCAFTVLNRFLAAPAEMEHVITGVHTKDGFQSWFIMTDLGSALELDVSWSEGSGYYSYGFTIEVIDALAVEG